MSDERLAEIRAVYDASRTSVWFIKPDAKNRDVLVTNAKRDVFDLLCEVDRLKALLAKAATA